MEHMGISKPTGRRLLRSGVSSTQLTQGLVPGHGDMLRGGRETGDGARGVVFSHVFSNEIDEEWEYQCKTMGFKWVSLEYIIGTMVI